ncbi:MAG: hypothetical protein ACFE94_08660 [Candidatus Hodarchaeota archaeon]
MKFRTKYLAAYGIILFISGTAFIAGLLQENLTSEANLAKQEVADLQDTLERMEAKALFLTNRDIANTYKSIDIRFEATLVDNELDLLNTSLNPNEREVYIRKIVELLIYAQGMQNTLLIIHLYRHFNISTDDFMIAFEEADGYDYFITYEMWQTYNSLYGSPVYIWTAYDYYGLYFSYPLIQLKAPQFRPHDPDTSLEIFIFEGGGIESVLDYFLYTQIREIQDQKNFKSEKANILEAKASYISLGVSLTTISMVLASAMITRINHKKMEHEFAILKEIEGRKEEIKPDIISIPILVIATVLSILGMIFALI